MARFSNHALLVMIVAAGPQTARADELSSLLECRDVAALAGTQVVAADRARSAGYDCRMHERDRQSTVYCTGQGAGAAFGMPVKEFNLVKGADGGATLSVAFDQPPSRVEPAIARARARMAEGPGPLSTATVDEREDGVAELRCVLPGDRSGSGAIAGRLDFRGVEPVPSMRVCAAPVRDPRTPRCVESATGQREYLIESLPAGDYYVTAYALESNPNRLFGAYTSTLQTCPDGAADCAGRRLQRVTVFPDDVRSGIDPGTLMTELPSALRSPRTAGNR